MNTLTYRITHSVSSEREESANEGKDTAAVPFPPASHGAQCENAKRWGQ